jgi:exodeoxyribonuclease VII large subunit
MSILTISQLNNYISFKLKSDIKLKGIMVQGEISNFVNHYKSGHLYFTLKDESSLIKAVMFASNASKLRFVPSEGMKVVVSGNVEVYERDGIFQIYVTDMQPSGYGALYLAYEQLKEKLSREGLFDEEYKKPIPQFPNKIGIITSASGAGLQDMLNIISRRYPIAEIKIYPAIVQGEQAPQSLCENLINADNDNNDVLIIGRGGGSFEDLFCFSNESVVREIFNCKTPVISAVGHETDFSLSDFVADLRAPTPSAAAELVVPDKNYLLDVIEGYKYRFQNAMNTKLDMCENMLHNQDVKLKSLSPEKVLDLKYNEVNNIIKRLKSSFANIVQTKDMQLCEKISLLNSLSPLNILSRGYSLVYKDKALIDNSKKVSVGDEINIKFSNSEINAVVTKV